MPKPSNTLTFSVTIAYPKDMQAHCLETVQTVRAAAAAMAIHKNLKGRKGFDHLFDDIDQETLVEMLAEHTEIIEKICRSGGDSEPT